MAVGDVVVVHSGRIKASCEIVTMGSLQTSPAQLKQPTQPTNKETAEIKHQTK